MRKKGEKAEKAEKGEKAEKVWYEPVYVPTCALICAPYGPCTACVLRVLHVPLCASGAPCVRAPSCLSAWQEQSKKHAASPGPALEAPSPAEEPTQASDKIPKKRAAPAAKDVEAREAREAKEAREARDKKRAKKSTPAPAVSVPEEAKPRGGGSEEAKPKHSVAPAKVGTPPEEGVPVKKAGMTPPPDRRQGGAAPETGRSRPIPRSRPLTGATSVEHNKMHEEGKALKQKAKECPDSEKEHRNYYYVLAGLKFLRAAELKRPGPQQYQQIHEFFRLCYDNCLKGQAKDYARAAMSRICSAVVFFQSAVAHKDFCKRVKESCDKVAERLDLVESLEQAADGMAEDYDKAYNFWEDSVALKQQARDMGMSVERLQVKELQSVKECRSAKLNRLEELVGSVMIPGDPNEDKRETPSEGPSREGPSRDTPRSTSTEPRESDRDRATREQGRDRASASMEIASIEGQGSARQGKARLHTEAEENERDRMREAAGREADEMVRAERLRQVEEEREERKRAASSDKGRGDRMDRDRDRDKGRDMRDNRNRGKGRGERDFDKRHRGGRNASREGGRKGWQQQQQHRDRSRDPDARRDSYGGKGQDNMRDKGAPSRRASLAGTPEIRDSTCVASTSSEGTDATKLSQQSAGMMDRGRNDKHDEVVQPCNPGTLES